MAGFSACWLEAPLVCYAQGVNGRVAPTSHSLLGLGQWQVVGNRASLCRTPVQVHTLRHVYDVTDKGAMPVYQLIIPEFETLSAWEDAAQSFLSKSRSSLRDEAFAVSDLNYCCNSTTLNLPRPHCLRWQDSQLKLLPEGSYSADSEMLIRPWARNNLKILAGT